MNLLEIAITAAIDAGKEIMRIYNTADFNVEIKSDDSPLTIADKNANARIMTYLEPTGIPIISEENKLIEYEVRKQWEQCWIVDPLDGTKEFIKRNGEFTVNIALTQNGISTLGVIYVPVTKTVYFTAHDKKSAFKLVLESEDQQSLEALLEKAQKIEPASSFEDPIKIVGSRSHLNDDTKAFIDNVALEHEVEIVSKGSSLKFCLVAEGLAHYYPRFAPTMEWDTAAGQAICEAAGVQVIDQRTQAPLLYNREDLLNPYFLVTQ